MYELAYHLNADPFRLSPDHRFCFRHKSYVKAKSYLQYALQRAEGFVMITGTPGTGKTTLLDDLLTDIDEVHTIIARLVTTQLAASDLLKMVAFAFKLDVRGLDKATILQSLEQLLIKQHGAQRRALLIVDEAQNLEDSALEEMRLLTNLQVDSQPLLQVFLVGQERLHDILNTPEMEQLHQRLIACSRLNPMDADETATYVMHRLGTAGWHQDPQISLGALRRIHVFSQGIPRRVNQLCSRLLLYGAAEDKHTLDSKDVQAVIIELREEHLAPEMDIDPPEGLLDDDDKVIASVPEDDINSEPTDPNEGDQNSDAIEAPPPKVIHIQEVKAALSRGTASANADGVKDHGANYLEFSASRFSAHLKPIEDVEPISEEHEAKDAHDSSPISVYSESLQQEMKITKVTTETDDQMLQPFGSDNSGHGIFTIVSITMGLLFVSIMMMQTVGLQSENVTLETLVNGTSPEIKNHEGSNSANSSIEDEFTLVRVAIEQKLSGRVVVVRDPTQSGMTVRIAKNVSFALGSDGLSPALRSILAGLAVILKDHEQIQVHVIGHSDLSGSRHRNATLSARRAQVVVDYFVQQGIPQHLLRAEGRGTSELRSQIEPHLNRRVDIYLEPTFSAITS